MRAFVSVAAANFKAQLAWRFDVVMNVLFTLSRIILAYILWGAVFDGRSEVAGFTFQAMLTYYVVSVFFSNIDLSSGLGSEISDRIKHGVFSGRMVLPMNTRAYHYAQTVGAALFYGIFNLIAAVVWTLLLGVKLTLTSSPALIFGALAMAGMGLFFMMQFNFLIGISAFRYVEVWMFIMIKDNLIQFVTGAIIPIALLPETVLRVMSVLPFYYVTYLPTMLLIGRNANELMKGLVMLTAWNALFLWLNRFMYDRLRVRYDGVGI